MVVDIEMEARDFRRSLRELVRRDNGKVGLVSPGFMF